MAPKESGEGARNGPDGAPLRIGFIGAGGIAQTHASRYEEIPGVVLAAAADIAAPAREGFGERFGVTALYDDYRRLLREAEVDAVDICLPTYLHAEAVQAAAAVGVHIFCEKPPALRLEEAEAMARACARAGVKLTYGFVRRYDPRWLAVRQLVQDGAIGRPVLWRHVMGSTGPPSAWYMERQQGGGPFIDGAIHHYDFARTVFGEARQVYTDATTLRGDRHTALDTGTTTIRFQAGDSLMLSWSWALPQGCRAAGIHELLGPRGRLLFKAPADAETLSQGADPGHYVYVDRGEAGGQAVHVGPNRMFLKQFAAWVRALRQDDAAPVSGAEGIRSLKVALAVLEAGEKGEVVAL